MRIAFWSSSLDDELLRAQRDGLEAERCVVALREQVVAMKEKVVATERSRDLWVWIARGRERRLEEAEGQIGTLVARNKELLVDSAELLATGDELRGLCSHLERELEDTRRAYNEAVDRLAAKPKRERTSER